MKTNVLFTAALMMIFLCSLTAQVIPNYNFENWINGANAAPSGWSDKGSHHTGFYPVIQTTDKYLGTYAVKIENKVDASDTTKGEMWTTRPNGSDGFGPAFPISTRYDNLKGFYKYTPLNGDSA